MHYLYKCTDTHQVEDYDKRVAAAQGEEEALHKEKNALMASRLQLESFQNAKYAPMITDINERMGKVDEKLQTLRERRIEIKHTAEHCNHFTDEGNIVNIYVYISTIK